MFLGQKLKPKFAIFSYIILKAYKRHSKRIQKVYKKLIFSRYGYEIVDPMGPIPEHLLGNMWAQSWTNLATMLRPYPMKPSIDVSQE
jgi:hypothetical protein